MSLDDLNDSTAYEKYKTPQRKEYKGGCYTCGKQEYLSDLLEVKDSPNRSNFESFMLCEMCHCALWHGHGGDQYAMYKDLRRTQILRERDKEFNDKARLTAKPITLELVAELCWNLTYDGKGWINELFNSLENKSQ